MRNNLEVGGMMEQLWSMPGFQMVWESHWSQIGIKICDFSRQNQGLGKVILSLFINALFNDYGYHKIILDTNLNNSRSQHVYEQLGFEKIRISHNSWKDQLGRWQSTVDYELTKVSFVSFFKRKNKIVIGRCEVF